MQVPGGAEQTCQAWGGEQSGCPYCVRAQAIAFPAYADLLRRHWINGRMMLQKQQDALLHIRKHFYRVPFEIFLYYIMKPLQLAV